MIYTRAHTLATSKSYLIFDNLTLVEVNFWARDSPLVDQASTFCAINFVCKFKGLAFMPH